MLYRIILILMLSTICHAEINATNEAPLNRMSAVIIQDTFTFDNNQIQTAEVIKNSDGIYQGLHLKLKPRAAEKFAAMTETAIGKDIWMMLNGKILTIAKIESALTGDLLIKGMSEQEAYAFIRLLNVAAGKPLVRDYVVGKRY